MRTPDTLGGIGPDPVSAEGPLDDTPIGPPVALPSPAPAGQEARDREYLAELLADAEHRLADCEEKLYAALDGHLAAAGGELAKVEGLLRGQVGTLLDQASDRARKPLNKLGKELDRLVDNAYSYWHQAGLTVPTMDEVVAELDTGQYQPTAPAIPAATVQGTDAVTRSFDGVPEGFECMPGTIPYQLPGGQWACYWPNTGAIVPPVSSGTAPPYEPPPPPVFPDDLNRPLPPPVALPPYTPPPGLGRQDLWCPPGGNTAATNDQILQAALDAGWTGQHQATAEHPFDTQIRPPGYDRRKIWGNYVMPDFAGACPVGLVNNGGTGFFFNVCVTPPCFGQAGTITNKPAPVPPPAGPTCVPTCPPGFKEVAASVAAVCAELKAPACDPPKGMQLPPPVDLGNRCDELQRALERVKDRDDKISDWFHMAHEPQDESFWAGGVAQTIVGLFGQKGPVLPSLVKRLADFLNDTVRKSVESLNCDPGVLVPITIMQAGLKFLNKYTSVVPDQTILWFEQFSNTACQMALPTGSEADRAYLADQITKTVWECWHKAAGDLVGPAEQVMAAGRSKLDPLAAVTAKRREVIDQARYDKLLRENGYITDEDKAELLEVTKAWPAVQDAIRFMVRDVADEEAVERGKLDEDFEKKWAGKLAKYGDGLGIDKELARFFWRAHWQLPSFTQLSEMLHRLRPGRVAADVAITEKQVEQTIQQDDMSPAFVRRLMAISYHTVTRSDLWQIWTFHVIDRAELVERFQDLGDRKEDAEIQAEQWDRRRKRDEARASGLPAASTLVNEYAKGEVSDEELREVAERISITPEQAQDVLNTAEFQRNVMARRYRIQAVKRRYVRCLIGEQEATDLLAAADVDVGAAGDLVDHWQIQRNCRGKEFSAGQLCGYFQSGLITAAALAAGIRRAGYSQGQAGIMVADCQRKLAAKQQKEAEKVYKAELARAEKERKRLAKLAADAKKCKPKPCPPGRESDLELLTGQAGGDGEVTPGEPAPGSNGAAGH